MYSQRNNPSATPSAQPPAYDIEIPSNPTKEVKPAKVTPERKPKQSAGVIGDFIQDKDNKLVILEVATATGLAFLTLKAILPDSDLLKIFLNPIFHTVAPSLILYASSVFGWKKGVKIGFFWQFIFTPVALLIVR